MGEIIFINYRRDQDEATAGRLCDQLESAFGRDQIFIDVDSILPGKDFAAVLEDKVSQCDIFLAVIGRNWANRRLLDPNDWVRMEIEAALEQQKTVIPVLINAAELPRIEKLPKSLAPLLRHQAVRVKHESFRPDVQRLVRAIASLRNEALTKETQARQKAEDDRRREEEADTRLRAEDDSRRRLKVEAEEKQVEEEAQLLKAMDERRRRAEEAEAWRLKTLIDEKATRETEQRQRLWRSGGHAEAMRGEYYAVNLNSESHQWSDRLKAYRDWQVSESSKRNIIFRSKEGYEFYVRLGTGKAIWLTFESIVAADRAMPSRVVLPIQVGDLLVSHGDYRFDSLSMFDDRLAGKVVQFTSSFDLPLLLRIWRNKQTIDLMAQIDSYS